MTSSPDINPDHAYSVPLELSQFNTQGFALNYPIRIHKSSEIATLGTDALRSDWRQHIGPVTKYGCHNPTDGHCVALMWPLVKPERLFFIAYIIEYVFLYDHVLEDSVKPELSDADGKLVVEQTEHLNSDAVRGTKVLQKKMIKMLKEIDEECTEQVERGWRGMVAATALHDKSQEFKNLEEYLDFRVVDAGGPLCLALMCWGMGFVLTPAEEEIVQPALKLGYAAVSLANDVVSFDQEFADFKTMNVNTLANAVWLYMRWNNITDTSEAKRYMAAKTVEYEAMFLQAHDELLAKEDLVTPNIRRYMEGLTLHASGYIIWHLNCPRYHKEARVGLKGYLDVETEEPVPEKDEKPAAQKDRKLNFSWLKLG